MDRCLQLARNGFPAAMPNPAVGAVLVVNDQIIGEGYTSAYGGPHAEVNAINSVRNENLLKKATLYVSLEPCSHYGKTPPCSDLIIAKNIPKIVIGTVDPFAKVAGRGIEKLFTAGREVIVGALEEECQAINTRFFTFHKKKRPFIILKWAQTLDGFIAPSSDKRDRKKPVWITNDYSRQRVHKLRTEEQAILVGTNTVLQDNPSLTARDWHGNNPLRVVIDREGKIPTDSTVFNGETKTLVFTEKQQKNQQNLEFIEVDFNKNLPEQICSVLFEKEIQSLIVEGGTQTLQGFIDAQLWDETWVFTGNNSFQKGIKSPVFQGKLTEKQAILEDILRIYSPTSLPKREEHKTHS
ncbi:MAG TPA: bifunctional diaminohydroxyphosphoribosylaminopyrimidine deaminase/5-amino-6-(5-phosphoribosylamino)uracil reductase RibD [Leeuwenhoekiella sp.]|nr:bifunctional diaminohydroxyphosphoribosylaminopyrimidine deaminase/5-amino-6-(5-phosphoribosylamino)uracil reductase RibD [Leeuwenhoekiella sp.]